MEGGRAVVGVGRGTELGTLGEQVQEVELSGGEWGGDLLCFCKTCSPRACLPLCESDVALIGDLVDEAPLQVAGGQ